LYIVQHRAASYVSGAMRSKCSATCLLCIACARALTGLRCDHAVLGSGRTPVPDVGVVAVTDALELEAKHAVIRMRVGGMVVGHAITAFYSALVTLDAEFCTGLMSPIRPKICPVGERLSIPMDYFLIILYYRHKISMVMHSRSPTRHVSRRFCRPHFYAISIPLSSLFTLRSLVSKDQPAMVLDCKTVRF
jgi:hypothetical protein